MRSHDVAELAQTFFEEIGDAAFITDPGTMLLVNVNPMAQRMTGLPRGELLRLTLGQLFRSDNDKGLAHLHRVLHTTQTFHSQEGYFLHRGSDGFWIPVNLTLTRLHTQRGQLGLVLARDITERIEVEARLQLANAALKGQVQERIAELARVNATLREEIANHERAAGALRDSEERFRGAFEHTSVAMVLTDIDNRFIRVNVAYAQMFGYSPPEMLGMAVADVTHPDDIAKSYEQRESLLAGRGHFFQMEKRYLHRDGHIFWGLTNVSLVRDPVGRPRLYVSQVQDITDWKRSQEVLHKAQQRLAHVIKSSPAVLFTLATEGNRIGGISWISDNLQDMLGYTPAEAYHEGWWLENAHPEDREALFTQTQGALFGQGYMAQEYRFRHRNGKYRWTRCEIRLVRDVTGRLAEAVGSWTDITEHKLLEDQFRQSQKMEAIGRLAGGVAHDFNNLLTIINGYGEVLLAALPASDPTRDPIREIVAAGERAASLTRQLLAFSRNTILEPKVLDLKVLVAEVERMLRRIVGEDIQLAIVVDPEVGAVKADPGQIEQVILNLVVNARDALPRGGLITIEVQNAQLDETYTRLHPDARPGSHVLLAVTDNGCGMDAATISRVFEPFFTTKGESGTGLGLATVHGIVRQAGGHVAVYSEVGHGSTFKVYLPFVTRLQHLSSTPPSQYVMPGGDETVLVVEDEDGVRSLLRRVLRECGYTVLEARDGLEALQIADEHPGRIDLLMTDVIMPQLDGCEVAERTKVFHPEIKILLLSGYTDDAVLRYGILEGEVTFLQKPFTPVALARKVRDILDTHKGAGRKE